MYLLHETKRKLLALPAVQRANRMLRDREVQSVIENFKFFEFDGECCGPDRIVNEQQFA